MSIHEILTIIMKKGSLIKEELLFYLIAMFLFDTFKKSEMGIDLIDRAVLVWFEKYYKALI